MSVYSFEPAGFGPRLWFVLHTAAAAAPTVLTPADRAAWLALLRNLHVLIPCKTCRTNYIKKIAHIDVDNWLRARDDLFDLTVRIHNSVNGALGKPQFCPRAAAKLYGKGTARGVAVRRSR
ncbi:ERV1/ALR family protein [Banggai cardinalfish iridovirus]|uniref:Sulfhydryl oxidase n=1 Tax=Banggai cardinalfish iridovirus TaxID=565290 RepID=A0A6M3QSK0_ISKNV|nr:ERV1/ALR family protein [Banggai cardinalfish iridovirus]UWH18830.1 ERV1 ALR family protein [Infectious spleen and kidney necrosis virus]WEP24580.1 ERV1/ALR family protein [Largemouth bass ulcerative syndrome virus]